MSHTVIITRRVLNAAKATVTGDAKYASLLIAVASAFGGGYFF